MMTPMPSGMLISRRIFFEALSFPSGFSIFAGNAALVGIGKQNEVAARQSEIGGHARALVADGPLVTCTMISLPGG